MSKLKADHLNHADLSLLRTKTLWIYVSFCRLHFNRKMCFVFRQAPANSPSRQTTLTHQHSVTSNKSEVNGKEDGMTIKFERIKNLNVRGIFLCLFLHSVELLKIKIHTWTVHFLTMTCCLLLRPKCVCPPNVSCCLSILQLYSPLLCTKQSYQSQHSRFLNWPMRIIVTF